VDDVGVDAEASDRSVDTLGLAKRFFAPGEARLLASLPTERRIDAFYRLWTLKESFIKAVGQGLSIPLDAFFFTLDPFAFDCAPAIACDPRDWQFQSIAHDASYAMAVALHRPGGGSMMIHHETIELNALVPGGEAANSR
jgi:4'-phosphopantetheinyl transferase